MRGRHAPAPFSPILSPAFLGKETCLHWEQTSKACPDRDRFGCLGACNHGSCCRYSCPEVQASLSIHTGVNSCELQGSYNRESLESEEALMRNQQEPWCSCRGHVGVQQVGGPLPRPRDGRRRSCLSQLEPSVWQRENGFQSQNVS